MDLPEELWQRVILGAVEQSRLDHRDVCLISMLLWDREIGSSSAASGEASEQWKTRFVARYESIRLRKQNEYKRRVLRTESQVWLLKKLCKNAERSLELEKGRLASARKEISRANNARQASTALQIWQPQSVRTSHQQVIQQQEVVHPEIRMHNLEMEVKVCKEQIQRLQTSLNVNRMRLARADEELRSLSYRRSS